MKGQGRDLKICSYTTQIFFKLWKGDILALSAWHGKRSIIGTKKHHYKLRLLFCILSVANKLLHKNLQATNGTVFSSFVSLFSFYLDLRNKSPKNWVPHFLKINAKYSCPIMNLKPPLQALAALVHNAVGKCALRRDFASNRHNIILKPCELVLILFRLKDQISKNPVPLLCV